MRTTVDVDTPILAEVKRLAKKEGKSLGRMVSDLLARALRDHGQAGSPARRRAWKAKGMGARVDLSDREAVYAAMENEDRDEDVSRVAEETRADLK